MENFLAFVFVLLLIVMCVLFGAFARETNIISSCEERGYYIYSDTNLIRCTTEQIQ